MKNVTEKMKPQEEWFKRAEKISTIDELAAFAKELLDDTVHDYGTVCHAIGALALGAAWLGASKQGITGFQAGFVMWDFVRQWSFRTNKCGLKIVDYDNMLYPQYESSFCKKTITSEQFKTIQQVAEESIRERAEWADPIVVEHWKNIVSGVVPFGYSISDED